MCSWESRSVHPRAAMAPRALCRDGRGVSRLHPEGRVPRTSQQPRWSPVLTPDPSPGAELPACLPPPHHLRALAGPAQAAGQQLQHHLTVEQPRPAGGAQAGRWAGQAPRPFLGGGEWGGRGQWGALVRGSLFDEVLSLLLAQEGAWPLCHHLD